MHRFLLLSLFLYYFCSPEKCLIRGEGEKVTRIELDAVFENGPFVTDNLRRGGLLTELENNKRDIVAQGKEFSREIGSSDELIRMTVKNTMSETNCITIVMVAHNEHAYLMSTLDSIIAATPVDLIHKIVLVDDGSSPPMENALRGHWVGPSHSTDVLLRGMNNSQDRLGRTLEGSHLDAESSEKIHESNKEAHSNNTPKQTLKGPLYKLLKIVRSNKRVGLIKNKVIGAELAREDDLVIFLDCHVKPENGWIDQIFRKINVNFKRTVVPEIPILDPETWTIDHRKRGKQMLFDWSLKFHWISSKSQFVPILSGGILAINKKWWDHTGALDPYMTQWGGENIELSVRQWLCGGELVTGENCVVGHVYRDEFPYTVNESALRMNEVRTIETWFENYGPLYYQANPHAERIRPHITHLESRLELKQRLQCKPFQWFVDRFGQVMRDDGLIPRVSFMIELLMETNMVVPLKSARDPATSDFEYRKSFYEGLIGKFSWRSALEGEVKQEAETNGDNSNLQEHVQNRKILCVEKSEDNLVVRNCDAEDKAQRFMFHRNSLMHVASKLCVDAGNPIALPAELRRAYALNAVSSVPDLNPSQRPETESDSQGLHSNPESRHIVATLKQLEKPLRLLSCNSESLNQRFEYFKNSGRITYASLCMAAPYKSSELYEKSPNINRVLASNSQRSESTGPRPDLEGSQDVDFPPQSRKQKSGEITPEKMASGKRHISLYDKIALNKPLVLTPCRQSTELVDGISSYESLEKYRDLYTMHIPNVEEEHMEIAAFPPKPHIFFAPSQSFKLVHYAPILHSLTHS